MNSPLRSAGKLALPTLPVALAAATPAMAQIVYTDFPDITANKAQSESIYFDLDRSGGGTTFASTNLDDVPGRDFQLYFPNIEASKPYIINLVDGGAVSAKTGWFATNFAAGAVIEPPADAAFFEGLFPILTSPDPYFLGLRLTADESEYFGWARITSSESAVTLHDFAYNSTPGGEILAGATASVIPEPSTYAAVAGLLAGSAALYARRRKANRA